MWEQQKVTTKTHFNSGAKQSVALTSPKFMRLAPGLGKYISRLFNSLILLVKEIKIKPVSSHSKRIVIPNATPRVAAANAHHNKTMSRKTPKTFNFWFCQAGKARVCGTWRHMASRPQTCRIRKKNPNVTREALPNVSSKISRTLGLTELYLTQTTPSILEPVAVWLNGVSKKINNKVPLATNTQK